MRKSLHNKDYDAFLALLRSEREGRGMLQAELAKKLKEPQSFVSKCETGQRRLDIVELHKWCAALGVDFAAFCKRLKTKLGHR